MGPTVVMRVPPAPLHRGWAGQKPKLPAWEGLLGDRVLARGQGHAGRGHCDFPAGAVLTALAMMPFMVPARAAAMPNLPLLRMCMATLKPPPTSPSTFSAGTRTPSKYTSAVFEALMPIFFSGGPL